MHKNCGYVSTSSDYSSNMAKFTEILKSIPQNIDMQEKYNVQVIFHILTPVNKYKQRSFVEARAKEILQSVNNDFNNYGSVPETHTLSGRDESNINNNNYKYKKIINNVFSMYPKKKSIYLSDEYVKNIPASSSNITFELNQLYFYPVSTKLDLRIKKDEEEQIFTMKKYILNNQANAIYPNEYLNIWILDTINNSVLASSSFPWTDINDTNGVILSLQIMFPEEFNTEYNLYKTFSHEIGHYLGLLHVFSQATSASSNTNMHNEIVKDVPKQNTIITDPTTDRILLSDVYYCPLFMNVMSYCCDKYICGFTKNQIEKMRFMLKTYRSGLITASSILPEPKDDKSIIRVQKTITQQQISLPKTLQKTLNPMVKRKLF